jgi:hypothetical protein
MFHDPIKAKPKEKSAKTPWNFEAPQYDDRTKVCAGTHYGVGHRQPIGHGGDPKTSSAVLPMKSKSMPAKDDAVRMEMDH